ncbi:hypothetical protein KR018_006939 [Drosophila ironensis]|nr:hypothetical protein KR018_006939 [Drosophila ironensis]
MNFATSSVLLIVGLVLGAVYAQGPGRETSRDRACGPGRYYSEARHTCLPW